jgi:hypothetical protein
MADIQIADTLEFSTRNSHAITIEHCLRKQPVILDGTTFSANHQVNQSLTRFY